MKAFKILLGSMFGFLFAVVVYALGIKFPILISLAGAPAEWVFDKWHQIGLPPRGEAALAGPFLAYFIWWTLVGLIAGIIWASRGKPFVDQ